MLKIRLLSQRNRASYAWLPNHFLFALESLGILCWDCHERKWEQFHRKKMRIIALLRDWCMHTKRSPDGLRMSEYSKRKLLLENWKRISIRTRSKEEYERVRKLVWKLLLTCNDGFCSPNSRQHKSLSQMNNFNQMMSSKANKTFLNTLRGNFYCR